MPTATYKALANVTLASAGSTVTFSSIPSTYRDLILVVVTSGTAITSSGLPRMRFNADSGSNYQEVWMQGVATSFQSGTGTGTYIAFSSNAFLHSIIQIMDYAVTDKNKVVLTKWTENNTGLVQMRASRWASTSAITTITCDTSAGNYPIGSTFSLYGVIA
jgi:hypothetical protein